MNYYVDCTFLDESSYSVCFTNKEDVIAFLDRFGDKITSLSIIEGDVCEELCLYWSDNYEVFF